MITCATRRGVIAGRRMATGLRLSAQRLRVPGDLAGPLHRAEDGTAAQPRTGPGAARRRRTGAAGHVPTHPGTPRSAADRAWGRMARGGLRTGRTGRFCGRPANATPQTPRPRVATTMCARGPDDAFALWRAKLLLRRAPCRLPGRDMPFPFQAALSAPDSLRAQGCAGDPLCAPWKGRRGRSRICSARPCRAADDGASAFALQFDTGRLSGRTSCNRFLGRAASWRFMPTGR